MEIYLTIEGQNSRIALCMYADFDMAYDIDQIGLNLCNDDETRFSQAIGACRVIETKARKGKAKILIDLPGEDDELKEQVLEEFFSSFSDYIRPTLFGLRSRGMGKYEFNLTEYTYEVLQPSLTS